MQRFYALRSGSSVPSVSGCRCFQPFETEHESRFARPSRFAQQRTWHNIHVDSCRISPHEKALQIFVLWWMLTCLSCQNGQTSLESAYLLHYWSSLNSGLLLGLTWDFSHLYSSCCSSLLFWVWHMIITWCLRQVWIGRPTSEDRLTPLGRARSFVLQTEFRAAENIPCYVLTNIIIRS